MRRDSFLTTSYKCGWIHYHVASGRDIFEVQVDAYAYAIQVKSTHAAKILITKHWNRIQGGAK